MRVSAVQYGLKTIASFAEFQDQVRSHVQIASEFDSQIVLFPEFLTTQLLSIQDASHIGELPAFTGEYCAFFQQLAIEYGMYIVGGTHVTERNGCLYNTAYFFYPSGRIETQDKIHITPSEKIGWNIEPGDELRAFDTPFGKVGILTCYDMEFPELGRMMREKGVEVLLCPSCTDDQHGFHRVRYTCHARAIENEMYVVVTGTIGGLPTVPLMGLNYGQAAVITPNDLPFPPKGIQLEGIVNTEMVITTDLNLETLRYFRKKGSVTTWKDRRVEFYRD